MRASHDVRAVSGRDAASAIDNDGGRFETIRESTDGVDRDGLDLNEQVVRARLRYWQVNVNETFGIGDRQGPGDGDGVHAFHDPTVVPTGLLGYRC